MVLNNIYYAKDIPSKSPRNQKTRYYFTRGNSTLDLLVKTKGLLWSLESLSEKECTKLFYSGSYETFFKKRDYSTIHNELAKFGYFIRNQFIQSNTPVKAENCNTDLESKGYRKLKPFEEEIFLGTLYNRVRPPISALLTKEYIQERA